MIKIPVSNVVCNSSTIEPRKHQSNDDKAPMLKRRDCDEDIGDPETERLFKMGLVKDSIIFDDQIETKNEPESTYSQELYHSRDTDFTDLLPEEEGESEECYELPHEDFELDMRQHLNLLYEQEEILIKDLCKIRDQIDMFKGMME